jgi:preprotein translocase subunit SecE
MARKRRTDTGDDDQGKRLAEGDARPARRSGGGGSGSSSTPSGGAGRARPGPQAKTPKAGSVTKAVQQGRLPRFFQEVVAELKKVSWPTRTQLIQATTVVIVAVAIIATFLGLADQASSWIVKQVF